MEGKHGTNQAAVVARIAWLAAFVVPLILAGMLLAVKTAHATPSGGAVVPFALDEELEGESEAEAEGDDGEDACGEAVGEFEASELDATEVEEICDEDEDEDQGKAHGNGSTAPEECLVRSARARVVVYPSHNTVRLTVGYTTYEPTAAKVEYSLTGGRGSLHMGAAKRHLGRSGVIRLARTLSDSQMSKVEAAGHFTVRLHSTEAPAECKDFETERLSAQRGGSKRLAVWSPAG